MNFLEKSCVIRRVKLSTDSFKLSHRRTGKLGPRMFMIKDFEHTDLLYFTLLHHWESFACILRRYLECANSSS